MRFERLQRKVAIWISAVLEMAWCHFETGALPDLAIDVPAIPEEKPLAIKDAEEAPEKPAKPKKKAVKKAKK